MIVKQYDPDGAPTGVYEITYWRVAASGSVRRSAACDNNVSLNQVEAIARRLDESEVMHARCNSQPGGLTAYGSDRARDAFQRASERGDPI